MSQPVFLVFCLNFCTIKCTVDSAWLCIQELSRFRSCCFWTTNVSALTGRWFVLLPNFRHTYPSEAASIASITVLAMAFPVLVVFLWKLENLSNWLACECWLSAFKVLNVVPLSVSLFLSLTPSLSICCLLCCCIWSCDRKLRQYACSLVWRVAFQCKYQSLLQLH